MSDWLEDLLDDWLSNHHDDYGDGMEDDFRTGPDPKTCRNCSVGGLHWRRVDGAWCLAHANGSIHICDFTKDMKPLTEPTAQEELDALPSWDQCLVHRLLYYVHSRPVLTDHEYDMLERRACQELELLCMAHPLDLPGSDLESSYPAPLRALARRFLS